MASMAATNVIRSNPKSTLTLVHSGASKAVFQLAHDSDLHVDASGTSKVALSGQVQGDGQIHVSGAAQLHAEDCKTRVANVRCDGNAAVRVFGALAIDAIVDGTSKVFYRGTLRRQEISGKGSIKPLDGGLAQHL